MATANLKPTVARVAVAKKPNSKATALRWYIKDHIGLLHNPATEELRAELAIALAKVKGRNAPAIIDICRDCVGEGAEANCRNNVRNCEIKDCLLFSVRPYQSKSKLSLEKATPSAFLRGNACKVEGSPTTTDNLSKKCNLENIAINCFSLES
jgi:hypothetical protein